MPSHLRGSPPLDSALAIALPSISCAVIALG
jgi:hypothetical protein